jgi:predicted metal-dependent HD superfamily phosphohydrolase
MNRFYLMKERWETTWQRLNARVPQDVLAELVRAYSSANRFYHNLDHIVDCLSIFDEAKFLAAHPEEVELAIWFHDAVYDTHRTDNEQKSAEWAESVIRQAGVSRAIAERVHQAVLATRHTEKVTDRHAQLMADVDLSILGREERAFAGYERNIRKEYAWVPEDVFRKTRTDILRGFLNRQPIYYHEVYRKKFEEQARANIKQAIIRLSDTTRAV